MAQPATSVIWTLAKFIAGAFSKLISTADWLISSFIGVYDCYEHGGWILGGLAIALFALIGATMGLGFLFVFAAKLLIERIILSLIFGVVVSAELYTGNALCSSSPRV